MSDMQSIEQRRLAASVDELLAGAERREPFVNPDGRSTAAFERVWIDGRPHIVKYVHLDDDFTMRVSGDLVCRPVRAWAAGLLDAGSDAGGPRHRGRAALGCGRNGWGAALLMRDVSDDLARRRRRPVSPPTSTTCSSTTWPGCAPPPGASTTTRSSGPHLLPYAARWALVRTRRPRGRAGAGLARAGAGSIAAEGWERFGQRAPADRRRRDRRAAGGTSHPLADALRATPSCFLHGDAKASNMGIGRRRPHGAHRLGLRGRGPRLPRARLVPGPRTGTGCPSPRRRRSTRSGSPSNATASTPPAGGTASSACACSAPSCSSAGRRRSATTTSWPGGATPPGPGRACCDRRHRRGLLGHGRRLAARPGPDLRPAGRGAWWPRCRCRSTAAAGARPRRRHRRGHPGRCWPPARPASWPSTPPSGMLAHDAGRRPPAVAGDALALPFAAGAFDAAVAAFSLNHLSRPGRRAAGGGPGDPARRRSGRLGLRRRRRPPRQAGGARRR